ncbi:DUF3277 family protein [Iocasia frigidifontis]|uniref:DUF3277 family protein n=1 Tax=Iocasia fonsfrigidae TaxID=2682810 RepID=A0A8A7K5H2_9FIRM|nr:phage protein [Iocasia fonsfrigidae]QTL96561.1 DUF3277 family protein [Iocasia fonsfrigidae]
MADQYDSTEIYVVVDGHVVTGFAEDSMISAERSEDKVETHVGAQGEVTFVKSANDVASMTITLKHNSPSIQKLQELYKAGNKFAVNVEDQNFDGDVSAGGSEAMISNPGSFERGGSVSDKEFTLLIADYEETFSGVS